MRRIAHASVDHLATWLEDRLPRLPQPFRAAAPGALDCFGPLPALPPGPDGAGRWSAPSPRPASADDRMALHVASAHGPARGTAVIVPPWKMGTVELVSGWEARLRRAGLEVWTLIPPHHLWRAEEGARSGEGFVTLDLPRFRAVLEQYVLEIRTAAALATARGPAGLVGLSLGALGAALAATGPEPLRFAALIAPPADLAGALDHQTAIGRRYRGLAARAGSPMPEREALREALCDLDPARRGRPAAPVWVAAGRFDAIAAADAARGLARAWGAPATLYPRGHLTLLFACRAARSDLVRFVATSLEGPVAAG